MKKLRLCAELLMLLSSTLLVNCTSDGGSTVTNQQNNDSIEAVAGEKSDTGETEEAENIVPSEVLTITSESKETGYEDESSYISGVWTLKIKNSGNATVAGNSYKISYLEIIEEWVGSLEDGGFDDVSYTKSVDGVDVEPNATVEVKITAAEGSQGLKSPKIVNL